MLCNPLHSYYHLFSREEFVDDGIEEYRDEVLGRRTEARLSRREVADLLGRNERDVFDDMDAGGELDFEDRRPKLDRARRRRGRL
jgi:hypothetical protein